MKTVQITSGGYGYREKAGSPTRLIRAGEFVCLDDAEAARLVQQGVAVYGEPDEETREIVEQADADSDVPEAQPEIEPQKNAPATKRTRKSKAATA